MDKVLFEGQTWNPLMPSSILRSSNVIIANYNIPYGTLAIDTANVAERPDYGFEFTQAGGNSVSIDSVELINNNSQVKITLSDTPTGTDQHLRYAWSCYVVASWCAQAGDATAVGGNIRDTDTSVSPSSGSTGLPLYDWSVSFNESIVVGNTSPTTTDNADDNWHSSDLTINLNPSDNSGSGIAHTYYCVDTNNSCVPTTEGTSVSLSCDSGSSCQQYIRYYSVDNLGNIENTESSNIIKIDKQNPTISAGDDQNKGATFTQVAAASDSGSDMNASTYQWAKVSGPGAVTFGDGTASSTTISVDTNGTYVISFTASDNVGNSNSHNFTLIWDAVLVTPAVTSSGGGGMPAGWSNLPITPTGGFKVFVNSGSSTTSNRNVILGFNAGMDIKQLAISMTGDFTDASREDYVAFKLWDLCSKFGGTLKNLICPDGQYTVYVKFYTAYGRSSDTASSIIVLRSGTTVTENLRINILPFTNPFTQYRQYRQTNADIKRLQIFLNSDPDTRLADSGVGSPGKETDYFGLLTYKAVIKFQEKYTEDVLAPWGLVRGTGYVGKTTSAKINELMGNE